MKKESLSFNEKCIRQSSYRPFMKSWLYFSKIFNEEIYHNDKIFNEKNIENKIICVNGIGAKTFSVLMTNSIPDLGFMSATQSFPLYWFDKSGSIQEGITDSTLKRFRDHYKNMVLLQLQSDDQVISFAKIKKL